MITLDYMDVCIIFNHIEITQKDQTKVFPTFLIKQPEQKIIRLHIKLSKLKIKKFFIFVLLVTE